MANDILAALKVENHDLKELLKRIKKGTEKEKLELIRLMLSAGEIRQQDQYYFYNF
jgi:hypothetical protein